MFLHVVALHFFYGQFPKPTWLGSVKHHDLAFNICIKSSGLTLSNVETQTQTQSPVTVFAALSPVTPPPSLDKKPGHKHLM